jgi:hypothetical protein
VLELEEIGDDDEKAFVIGILLSRLYEHWRSEGLRPDTPLRHVVVIEEAHRLLANVRFDPNPEVANTRGKAVETFVNMLSEVRAYGQGFIVVEQIPSKLAPDVVKNTNIMVMHRTVSGEDRLVLADATNMTEEQAGMLATLTVGQAAVFSEGDDRPILVGMDPFRRDGGERVASDLDSAIAASTAKLRDKLDAAPGRVGDVRADATDWDRALEVAEAPSVQRAVATYVLGVVERGTEGLDALDGIVAEGRRLQPGLKESPEYLRSLVVRGIDLHLRSLGGSYGWSFDEIAQVRDGLTPLVLDRLDVRLAGKAGEDPGALEGPVATVAEQYRGACRRTFDPYPACSAICDQDPPLCLYRHHAASSVGDDGVFRQFTSIIHSDEELAAVAPRLVEMCLATADRFAGPGLPAASRVRAGLCFATQVLEERIDVTPATRVRIGAELLTVARSTQD